MDLCSTRSPILFSLCGWNAWYAPPDPSTGYGGGKTLGNSFRIGPDDTNWHGILTNIDIVRARNILPFSAFRCVSTGLMLAFSAFRCVSTGLIACFLCLASAEC